MEFQWDEAKRISNLEKHGVDFLEAALIFEQPTLTKLDTRKDYGEKRYISLGMIDDTVYSVTHTERDGQIRLISAWKGGRSEYDKYKKNFT